MTKLIINFKFKNLIVNSLITILCFLILPTITFAQEEQESISFLQNELATAEGERKVDILNQLALRIEDLEQAKKYANDALALAQSMDYKDGIASAYIALGETAKYLTHNVLPTDSLAGLAKKYVTSVESIMLSSNLLDEAVFEGQILKIQTTTTIAVAESFFLKALETRKLQSFPDGQVWALQRLARLWEINGNMENAEKYYLEMGKIRASEVKTNTSGYRNVLVLLAEFYFRRAQKENVPSEKIFFIKKEDEIRDKMVKIREQNPKESTEYLLDILSTASFYWEKRNQVNKAERYFKKAVLVSKDIKKSENIAHHRLWEFYKKQGRTYFRNLDFDLSEQFFRNYIQSVESYYTKGDSLALQEIGNAYLNVADYYRQAGNYVGSEIYTLKAVPTRLKLNGKTKINWLKNRLLAIDASRITLDSLARLRVREFYGEDFKNLLATMPAVQNQEVRPLLLKKIIDLGTFLGSPTQMVAFYQNLIKSPATDTDSKLKLYLYIIKVIGNEANQAGEISRNYQQIINLTESIGTKNGFHFFCLAKAHYVLKNKQKAIDNAWKVIRNVDTPQPASVTTDELQEAKNILAALMKFDEVTDTTFIVHTVEKGETLQDLQEFYQVSAKCLKEWNYVDSNELVEGMKLKVCKKVDWVRSRKENAALPPNTSISHTVNKGETLASIAQKYNITLPQLQSYNNNALTAIYIGQKIWVGKYFMQCGCEE